VFFFDDNTWVQKNSYNKYDEIKQMKEYPEKFLNLKDRMTLKRLNRKPEIKSEIQKYIPTPPVSST
jgi:hypothetical protein